MRERKREGEAGIKITQTFKLLVGISFILPILAQYYTLRTERARERKIDR